MYILLEAALTIASISDHDVSCIGLASVPMSMPMVPLYISLTTDEVFEVEHHKHKGEARQGCRNWKDLIDKIIGLWDKTLGGTWTLN